jgi:hypothetical protein
MPKFPLATRFVIFPHALIAGSIWPVLDAIAMLFIPKPLTVVYSPVFENNFVAQFHFRVDHTLKIVQAKLFKQIRILVHVHIMTSFLILVEKAHPANDSPKPGLKCDNFIGICFVMFKMLKSDVCMSLA